MLLVMLAAIGCDRSPAGAGAAGPSRPGGAAGTAKPQAATTAPGRGDTLEAAAEPATSAAAEAPRRFVAYYFHRTARCPTCLSIEEQSRAAIELGCGDELSAGRLEWHAANIEQPGNGHFEQDFDLRAQSLVLVETAGGRVTRWKLLPRVWELVEDPYAFQEYVMTEVALFLSGG